MYCQGTTGVRLRWFLIGLLFREELVFRAFRDLAIADGFGRQKAKHADSTLMYVHIAKVSGEFMSQRERVSETQATQPLKFIPAGH